MNNLVNTSNRILPMSESDINAVRALEVETAKLPQVMLTTEHILHGGMYARTVTIPAGVVITGALIKVATMLIVSGHCRVYLDGKAKEVTGYNVFAASAHRKQAFFAITDTVLTTVFPCEADSIVKAEDEFTDDAHLLISRKDDAVNHITITGEKS